MTRPDPDDRTLRLVRELAPQVLGAVVRRYRDFAAAEDAVQEALLAASTQWPRDGLPDNPRGWLIQVASRRMTDQIRSDVARRRREADTVQHLGQVMIPAGHLADGDGDDTLTLLFLCCHPALTTASAIALALRAVGGLTTAEIAHAFFVPESTMAQRISRAKAQIRASGLPFAMPVGAEKTRRLGTVLHILYLIFNEGYTASSGAELRRTDLSNEAIRLVRVVERLLPDEAEVAGLLALMLLTDARRLARTTEDGALVPLMEQDRSRWDRGAITEGVALISRTLPRAMVGPYQLQAAIAAVHDEAARPEDTDWPQILALYEVLRRIEHTPVVRLNHAVAVAMVRGADAGLALVDALDAEGQLDHHHRVDAVRAHLHEFAGRRDEARAAYEAAAARTTSLPERHYLLAKAARLGGPGRPNEE
ncbi:MAG: DUF6596 domain-containing protein [Vicinamibacterales bacterium]